MSYALEWLPAGAGVALVAVLCAPPLAVLAFGGLLFAALAALLAATAAIAATPYLIFRSIRRRRRGSQ